MKKKKLRILGYAMIFCGLSVLGFFTYRKVSREIYLRKLLKENIVFEIPRLEIKVPVLEGTGKKELEASAGHFVGTGSPGHGNFCIAGHNSTIYAEVFNDLDKVQKGDTMYVTDIDDNRTKYTYVVTDYQIISPDKTEVLNEFGDDRITVISCTDDGKLRQAVVGKLSK
ncbi:class D sortase [Ruminococcus flavefaciens]|nr:class D sortase [Ruminococcus flavefaciens]